ncbi:MAG: sugar ABC transporter permease [Rhodobacterales bacterium]|nr:MAG: sugar ABC transporter permease [Rhodobacterales bacterium]
MNTEPDEQDFPPALEPSMPRKDRSFPALRVIVALILREMATTYGRSPGGYLWAIVEPVGMIVVLSFGFSLLMRSPSLGHSFMLFYATGYLVFNHYSRIYGSVVNSINYSRPLLKYPAVTWIDSMIARLTLALLTNLFNSFLIIGGTILVVGTSGVIDPVPVFLAFFLATMLGLGIGAMNSVLMGLFPIWRSLWNIAMGPLMIASAVIYIMEDLPDFAQNILWWNPLTHITGLSREGFFSTYHPNYISEVYVLVIGTVFLVLGLIFLRANYLKILNFN